MSWDGKLECDRCGERIPLEEINRLWIEGVYHVTQFACDPCFVVLRDAINETPRVELRDLLARKGIECIYELAAA